MRNVFKYLLITALVLLIGCSRDKRDESVNEEASPEVTEEPATGTGTGSEEEAPESGNAVSDIPSLSDIRSVKILMPSDNPRDGFKTEIDYDKSQTGNTDFIYEWKVNGSEITGANEGELKWQEGFKKGDTITVTVTPYNDLGQGATSAEGSFRIPNSPPVITSQPDTSFEKGKFSYTVEAQDPDGDSMDFSLKNAPKGMTIEPATGLIVWEYDEKEAGDYKVTVIVTDSEGARAVQDLTLSIHPQGSTAGEAQ